MCSLMLTGWKVGWNKDASNGSPKKRKKNAFKMEDRWSIGSRTGGFNSVWCLFELLSSWQGHAACVGPKTHSWSTTVLLNNDISGGGPMLAWLIYFLRCCFLRFSQRAFTLFPLLSEAARVKTTIYLFSSPRLQSSSADCKTIDRFISVSVKAPFL